MAWPATAAIPCALTEAELYGYCWGQVVDLSPMMPATQFWITAGRAYLCTAIALVFEGSILVYNPTMNEAEWVPVHGLANDLSWAKERSTVALENYVLHVPVEVAQITRLGASRIASCPGDDSSTSAEEAQHSDTQCTNPLTDTDPEQGMRVRMGQEDRLTWRMQWRETDSGALGIGKQSWRRPRDWPMMTRGQTTMLRSWGRMTHRGLHYPCVMRPPTPHLTPRGVQPRVCRGC